MERFDRNRTVVRNLSAYSTAGRSVSDYWKTLWNLARARALIRAAKHEEAARALDLPSL
jgi:hypothetical protein